MKRYHHLAACILALSALISSAHAAQQEALKMRWEVLNNDVSKPEAHTRARLSVTALRGHALPAQGWSLYFNIAYGVVTGPLDGNLMIEQVGGGMYRVRPTTGFKGLKAGSTLHVDYDYTGLLIKMERAPAGPYLVYDATPDVGHAVSDYQIVLPTRATQLQRPQDRHALVTPQDTYRRNAQAALLPAAALPPVFPTPLALKMGAGRVQLVRAPQVISGPGLKYETAFARALFARYLPQGDTSHAPLPLRLRIGAVDAQQSPEAYELSISGDDGINITGNTAAGVARGLQSLHDLLPLPSPGATQIELQELEVIDAPRFAYRGFQLDVARNFQPKEVVLKTLDLMATYKLNKLHFHITDDEGWRLEIPGLPELTSIGAVRGHSAKAGVRLPPAYGSGPRADDPHGSGYYTRADYIEILRYAAARHIEVIPEIEMPGHARAAVKAMEARYHRMQAAGESGAAQYLLSDFNDRSVYRSPQEYNDHVINPGLESSYAFIDHVVGEIAALHREAGAPLKTMHVGGDELPHGAWEKSPLAQALMQREKLAGVADLWDYFYHRVDGIVRKHGMYASGWEELGARRSTQEGAQQLPNPRFTQRGFSLYVWNNTPGNEDFAYRLANAGYDIVLAPVTNMYLDMAANGNPEEPGVNWGAYLELDTVYGFKPLGAQLTEAGRQHIRGLEATLFSETIRNSAQLDYLMMPRLLALAERAWAPDPAWAQAVDSTQAAALQRSAWSGFVNTLGQRVLPRLDLERGDVAYRIAPPGLLLEGGKVLVNHVLPGLTLRYTTDGSTPTARSKPVTGPIAAKGSISAAAFDRTGRAGLVARIVNR
ncbi:carbohydate-binding domain-containing protein [Duganella sp. sic0402]|uniref:family 20 glycosylhydrolase n=1 Tax=Duganella sp. sic0402 TaxID=2854786 RepID=UPI001C47E5DB|nr:family 20 glycosylhydrolase [Duganella sp. sic0402]MBV7535447.1 carbohydate-binding domain-containing protein [Duganella sp. sic0402]